MFARLISFIVLLGVIALLVIFLAPEFADQYGNKDINTRIRTFKSSVESETWSASLYDQFRSKASSSIEEVNSTAKNIQNTFTTKTEQVKSAADSVQNAYSAVEKAKDDLRKLSVFSTGAVATGSVH